MDQTQVDSVMDEDFNILMLGTNLDALETLQMSVHKAWKERMGEANRVKYNCRIHTAQSVHHITAPIHIDFYVLLIDPQVCNALAETERQIEAIGGQLQRARVCLVPLALSYCSWTKPTDVWTFAKLYQMNLIVGKIDTTASLKQLSERILNQAEAGCGLLNGVPLIARI